MLLWESIFCRTEESPIEIFMHRYPEAILEAQILMKIAGKGIWQEEKIA